MPGESSCGGAVSEGGNVCGTSAGQSRERAKPPTAPLSSQPMQAQDMEQHELQQKKQQPVSQRLRDCMGGEGYQKAGATMLAQQDILQQQVPIVTRSSSTRFHRSLDMLQFSEPYALACQAFRALPALTRLFAWCMGASSDPALFLIC